MKLPQLPARASMTIALGLLVSVCACDRQSASESGSTTANSATSASPSSPGETFEGEITMDSAGRFGLRKGGAATWVLKGSALRINGFGDDGLSSMIVNPPQPSWMLIPEDKQAIGVAFADVVSLVFSVNPSSQSSAAIQLERTGKKDVIAGYECDEWKVTSAKSHASACMARTIRWSFDFGQWPVGVNSPELLREYLGHFPLRHISYDLQNVETGRMVVTKIEKKSVNDTVFAVPADYKKMDLSPLIGGLNKLLKSSEP